MSRAPQSAACLRVAFAVSAETKLIDNWKSALNFENQALEKLTLHIPRAISVVVCVRLQQLPFDFRCSAEC